MRFKDLDKKILKWSEDFVKEDLFEVALYMQYVFMTTGICYIYPEKFGVISDYITMGKIGCPSENQRKVIIGLANKYGPLTNFYDDWLKSKKERDHYTKRVLNIIRSVRVELKNFVSERKLGIEVRSFMRISAGFLKHLQERPLTPKQKQCIYITEHKLGIYWDDLSPEENGLE